MIILFTALFFFAVIFVQAVLLYSNTIKGLAIAEAHLDRIESKLDKILQG